MTDAVPFSASVEAENRARVIAAYDVGGLRERGELDDISAFAAELCETPVALVTLVEEEFQQFLARTGTDLEGTSRDQSFCAHTILGTEILELPDLLLDPRFAEHPLVVGAPHVRFYAGAPFLSREGVPLGALCVLDVSPRTGLSPIQRRGLAILARTAMARLDDRRATREQRAADAEARRALEQSDLRFRTLADAMPQMVWSTRPDGFHDYYNARWYEFTGVPAGSTDGEEWNGVFHPDDQERAWDQWRHSLDTGAPYDIEYRLRRHDGDWRWVLGRALAVRGEDGAIVRWFGTCTDIHEQKLVEEEREVVAQELSHRIKNIFSVVAGLVQFTARNRPEFAGVAADLRQRITALGRAHDFVRPHGTGPHSAAAVANSLHGLLADLFAPYQRPEGDRIVVTGDEIAIDDRSATPLALLFHELATNATKYGALSGQHGHVAVTVARVADTVAITWIETGGPPPPPAGPAGFGSQLIEMSVVRQLGGTVTRDWREAGLALTVSLPATALRR